MFLFSARLAIITLFVVPTIALSEGESQNRSDSTTRPQSSLVTTTQPLEMVIDLSNAESAAHCFVTAINRMDIDSAKKIVTDTPQSQDLVAVMLENRKARQALREAVAEKIPRAEWSRAIEAIMTMDWVGFDVDHTRTVSDVDKTLLFTGNSDAPLVVVKVDKEWRVDYEHCLLAGVKTQVSVRAFRTQHTLSRDTFQQLADDLRAGKFSSTSDFKKAAMDRVKKLRQETASLENAGNQGK